MSDVPEKGVERGQSPPAGDASSDQPRLDRRAPFDFTLKVSIPSVRTTAGPPPGPSPGPSPVLAPQPIPITPTLPSRSPAVAAVTSTTSTAAVAKPAVRTTDVKARVEPKPPKRRTGWLLLIALVLMLVLAVAAVWVVATRGKPSSSSRQWAPSVEPLEQFVEATVRHPFEEPVPVVSLPRLEYVVCGQAT